MPERKPIPRSPRAQAKIERVMGEFGAGTLLSSSGEKVTSRDQALAIAASEARRVVRSRLTRGRRSRLTA